MKIKSIVILLACLLLLSGLTLTAKACCEGDPPGNPTCYECDEGVGVWVLKDWAECGQHSNCTGECHGGCYLCTCSDDPSKCTRPCHTCSGGNCIDDQSKCTGECHTCSGGYCEDEDSKCASDKCCDDGTCIKKCVDNAATCEWDMPDDRYVTCENFDPFDKSCEEIILGQLCAHRIVYRQSTAKCAVCRPYCAKNIVGMCAAGYAIRCWNVPIGLYVYCLCGDEELTPSYYSGNYEICMQ